MDQIQLQQEQLLQLLKYVGKTSQSPDEINNDEFVELHFHTEHSSLDGATRIYDIVPVVQEHGQIAIAVTDHGTMSSVFDVYTECKKNNIKLIPGMESYIVDDANKAHVRRRKKIKKTEIEDEAELKKEMNDEVSCEDAGVCSGTEAAEAVEDEPQVKTITSPDWESHVVLLPKNEVGYRNLLKLHFEGYVHKRVNTFGRVIPRIDLNILQQHKEGIIVLSACLGGQINQALIRGADDLADQLVARYRSIFEDYYIELQPIGMISHNDRFAYRADSVKNTEKLQAEINQKIAALAYKHKVPIVVTTDAHYARKEDRETHALLLATQSKKDISDPTCFYFPALYMMTAKELSKQFPNEWIRNTRKIADMCDPPKYLDFSKDYKIPTFPVPHDDADYKEWLAQCKP